MAEVWLARLSGKHGFEKTFAIKTIRAEFAKDPQFRAMFLDEGRLASKIAHENVVHVLDLGENAEALYLVMEHVEGTSLSRLRHGGPLPLAIALRVLADTCAGLHAAHELCDAAG